MKQYDAENNLLEVICNKCGRHLKTERGMLMEGIFEAEQHFGYFSRKDGSVHQFDLCEDCYDAWTLTFEIPVSKKEEYL